jgi:V/A-type H+/Na+-transporting ATPase subunit I
MIVLMKKVSVIVQEKDADPALAQLRALGVLHVEHQRAPSGKDIGHVQDDIALVQQVIGILSKTEFSGKQARDIQKPADWRLTGHHIVDMHKRVEQLQEYSLRLQNEIRQWEEWGDFDPEKVKSLSEKNIYIRLYQIPVKEANNLPADILTKKVSVVRGIANCAVISKEKAELPFKELELPKMSLSRMRARLKEDTQVIESIQKEIRQHARRKESFLKTREWLEKELEFNRARSGMGQEGSLAYLTGYIPFDAAKRILDTAKNEKWGIVVVEPSEEDAVPTLIRNPRWISFIGPVFKLLEIIPSYRELDISPLFLLFLSLFFGMIIGDAGYGVVYFLLTLWMHKKFSRKLADNRIFFLLYLFSSCAIFWGLLTGTVFGHEWYFKAGFKPFIPLLNDTNFLQAFCFFLGAFHLSLAHGWQAARKMPSLAALSDIGWICVLWAAFFLAKTLILNDPFPFFGKWFLIAGLFLVIFFTSPQLNILKTIGHGLGTVALNLVNNFTDVVSYIRLFAIGLAGVAIADTVNSLASGFGAGNVLAKTLVVFLGHTINILLGPMSVLVHGIRLNVLEFSSHAGLSWSGVAYKPLKE